MFVCCRRASRSTGRGEEPGKSLQDCHAAHRQLVVSTLTEPSHGAKFLGFHTIMMVDSRLGHESEDMAETALQYFMLQVLDRDIACTTFLYDSWNY